MELARGTNKYYFSLDTTGEHQPRQKAMTQEVQDIVEH